MEEYIKLDFKNLCRLCISFAVTNVDILARNTGFADLKSKIFDCLSIKVNEDDPFPKKICTSCLDKLESYYQYKSACTTADSTLQCYYSLFKNTFGNDGFIFVKSSEVGLPLQIFQDQITTNTSTNTNTCDVQCPDQRFIKDKTASSAIPEDSHLLLPGAAEIFLSDTFTTNDNLYDVEPPLQVPHPLNPTSSVVLSEPSDIINSGRLDGTPTSLPMNVENEKIIVLDMNKCNIMDYIDSSTSIYLVNADDKTEQTNVEEDLLQLNERTIVNTEQLSQLNSADVLTVNSFEATSNKNNSFAPALNQNFEPTLNQVSLDNINNFLNSYPEANCSTKRPEETINTVNNTTENLKTTEVIEIDSNSQDSFTGTNVFDEDSIDKLIRMGPQTKDAEQQKIDFRVSQANSDNITAEQAEINLNKNDIDIPLPKPLVIKYSKPSVPVISKIVAETTNSSILPLVVKQLDLTLLSRIKTTKSYFKYKCTYCNRKFRNAVRYQKHITLHIKKKTYTCKTCRITLQDLKAFRHHSKIHKVEDKQEYICQKCDKTFARYWHLCRHSESAHPDESEGSEFNCNVCSKQFLRKASLRRHTLFCMLCEKCNEKIEGKAKIKQHKELCCGAKEINSEKSNFNVLNQQKVINVKELPKTFTDSKLNDSTRKDSTTLLFEDVQSKEIMETYTSEEPPIDVINPGVNFAMDCSKSLSDSFSKRTLKPSLLLEKNVPESPFGLEQPDKPVTDGSGVILDSTNSSATVKPLPNAAISKENVCLNKDAKNLCIEKNTTAQLVSDSSDEVVVLSDFNEPISEQKLLENSIVTTSLDPNKINRSNENDKGTHSSLDTHSSDFTIANSKTTKYHLIEDVQPNKSVGSVNASIISNDQSEKKTRSISVNTIDSRPTKLNVDPNLSDIMKDVSKNPDFRKILLSYLNKCCKRSPDKVATSSISIQTQNDPENLVTSLPENSLLMKNNKSSLCRKKQLNIGKCKKSGNQLARRSQTVDVEHPPSLIASKSIDVDNTNDHSISPIKINNYNSQSHCTNDPKNLQNEESVSHNSCVTDEQLLCKSSGRGQLNTICDSETKTASHNSSSHQIAQVQQGRHCESLSNEGSLPNFKTDAQRQATDLVFSINDNLPDTLLPLQPNFEKAYKSCIEKPFCFIEGSNASFVDGSLENIFISLEPNFDTELDDIIKEAAQTLDDCTLETFSAVPHQDISGIDTALEINKSLTSIDLAGVSSSNTFNSLLKNVDAVEIPPSTLNTSSEVVNEICGKFKYFTTNLINVETEKIVPLLSENSNMISQVHSPLAALDTTHPHTSSIKSSDITRMDIQNSTDVCTISFNTSSNKNVANRNSFEDILSTNDLVENHPRMHTTSNVEFDKEKLVKECESTNLDQQTLQRLENSNVLKVKEHPSFNLNQNKLTSLLAMSNEDNSKTKTISEDINKSGHHSAILVSKLVKNMSNINEMELESKDNLHVLEDKSVNVGTADKLGLNDENIVDKQVAVDTQNSRNETGQLPQIKVSDTSLDGQFLEINKCNCSDSENTVSGNITSSDCNNSVLYKLLINRKNEILEKPENNKTNTTFSSNIDKTLNVLDSELGSITLAGDRIKKLSGDSYNSFKEKIIKNTSTDFHSNHNPQSVPLKLEINHANNKSHLGGTDSIMENVSGQQSNFIKVSDELIHSGGVTDVMDNKTKLINLKEIPNTDEEQDFSSILEIPDKYSHLNSSKNNKMLNNVETSSTSLNTFTVDKDKEATIKNISTEFSASCFPKEVLKLPTAISSQSAIKSKITNVPNTENLGKSLKYCASPSEVRDINIGSLKEVTVDKNLRESRSAPETMIYETNRETTSFTDYEINFDKPSYISEEVHTDTETVVEIEKEEYLSLDRCGYSSPSNMDNQQNNENKNFDTTNNDSTLKESEIGNTQVDNNLTKETIFDQNHPFISNEINKRAASKNLYKINPNFMSSNNDQLSMINAPQPSETIKEKSHLNEAVESEISFVHQSLCEKSQNEQSNRMVINQNYICETKETNNGIKNADKMKIIEENNKCSLQHLNVAVNNCVTTNDNKFVHVQKTMRGTVNDGGSPLTVEKLFPTNKNQQKCNDLIVKDTNFTSESPKDADSATFPSYLSSSEDDTSKMVKVLNNTETKLISVFQSAHVSHIQRSLENVDFNLSENELGHTNNLSNNFPVIGSNRAVVAKNVCHPKPEKNQADDIKQLSSCDPAIRELNNFKEKNGKKDEVQIILANVDAIKQTAEATTSKSHVNHISKGIKSRHCSTESSEESCLDMEENRLFIVDESEYPDSNFKHIGRMKTLSTKNLKADENNSFSSKLLKFGVEEHLSHTSSLFEDSVKEGTSGDNVGIKFANMSSCNERWLKIKGKRRFIEDALKVNECSEESTSKKQRKGKETSKTTLTSVSTDTNDPIDLFIANYPCVTSELKSIEPSKKVNKINKVSPLEGYVVLCDKEPKPTLEKIKIMVSPAEEENLPVKKLKINREMRLKGSENHLKPSNSLEEAENIDINLSKKLSNDPKPETSGNQLHLAVSPQVTNLVKTNNTATSEPQKSLPSSIKSVRTIHLLLEKFNRSNPNSNNGNIQQQLKCQPGGLKKRKKIETHICTKNK